MSDVWWRDRAECSTAPLDLVDATYRSGTVGSDARAEFKDSYCRYCPVARECFEEAMETGEAGIWGGTTARARTTAGSPTFIFAKPDPARLGRGRKAS